MSSSKKPHNNNGAAFGKDCIRVRDNMFKVGTSKEDEVLFTFEEARRALEIMPDLKFRGGEKYSLLTVHYWA